jgi:hypothetical protein
MSRNQASERFQDEAMAVRHFPHRHKLITKWNGPPGPFPNPIESNLPPTPPALSDSPASDAGPVWSPATTSRGSLKKLDSECW